MTREGKVPKGTHLPSVRGYRNILYQRKNDTDLTFYIILYHSSTMSIIPSRFVSSECEQSSGQWEKRGIYPNHQLPARPRWKNQSGAKENKPQEYTRTFTSSEGSQEYHHRM